MSDDDLNDAIARQHQWEAAESRRSWKKLADDYERIFGRPSTTPAGSPCSCDYHKHMTRDQAWSTLP